MTAIAGFCVDGVPVLLGDTLTSWKGPANDFRVPAVGAVDGVRPYEPGMQLHGLRQKISIISDSCAFAWAGNRAAAQAVLTDLRAAMQRTAMNAAAIQRFVARHDQTSDDIALMGWFVDESGAVTCVPHNVVEVDGGGELGMMFVQGSGTDAFRAMAIRDLRSRSMGPSGSASFLARKAGLRLASKLMQMEFRQGAQSPTLRRLFGGVWEVAVYMDGAFQKVPVVHAVGRAAISPHLPNCSISLELLIKQQYAGEVLQVRSAMFGRTFPGDIVQLANQQRFDVTPIIGGDVSAPLAPLSFDSDNYAHAFLVQDFEGGYACGEFTVFQDEFGGRPMHIEDVDDDHLRVLRDAGFATDVLRHLLEAYHGICLPPLGPMRWVTDLDGPPPLIPQCGIVLR